MGSPLHVTKKFNIPRAILMVGAVVVFGVVVILGAKAATAVGDINNDGTVNIFDLSILLSKWGSTDAASDLNHDGTVNVFDLSTLLSHWGQIAPTPTPTPSATPDPTANTCPASHPTALVTGYTVAQCEDFNTGFGGFGPYTGGGAGTVVGVGRTPSQCTVTGGILELKQAASGATCGGSMLNFTQKYGYWEVRMRAYYTGTSSGSAPHPVLILWPDSSTWTSEIDYFETNLGSPAGGYLHCLSNPSQNCYVIPSNAVDYSQWHVYGYQWTPTSMTGYIDGTQWWTTSNISSFNPPDSSHQTIQLDNLSGSTPVRPGEMDVDWVHMYK